MKNMLFGILLSAMFFGLLQWATTKRTVHAEVLTAPPAGRFQLVQLHPNADTEWSGILDTETGCTWLFTTNDADNPQIKSKAWKIWLQLLGQHSFDVVNYDPGDYATPGTNPDNTVDPSPYIKELSRVSSACSKARLQALSSAGGR